MRPEVKAFAELMSEKMDFRIPKRGEKWKKYTYLEWVAELIKEYSEFDPQNPDFKELIDISNWCMIGYILWKEGKFDV